MRTLFNRNSLPIQEWPETQTIPAQSYTVKQLFERFRKGIPVNVSNNNPIFADEENDIDLEKVNKMSIMDKLDLSKVMMEQNRNKEDSILKAEAKRKAKEKEPSKQAVVPPESPQKA